MLLNKKIAIIPDTNIYTPSKNKPYDITTLPLEKYYKQIKTIEISHLEDKIDILFPEVVLLELINHNKEKFDEKIIELKKINKYFTNLNITITGFENVDFKEYCEKLKNEYYEDLKIIPLPSNKEKLFNDIFNRCLNKLPPFETNIDKGFKDTLIFLSMIDFAKHNLYSEYVFFSEDKIFKIKKRNLETEFNKHLENALLKNCKFEIQNHKNINSYINEKFELFKELRDYISNEFYDEINNHYKTAVKFAIEGIEYMIESINVHEEDTLINQIDENKFEVEITLSCKYYSNEPLEKSLEKEIKTQYLNAHYIFKKEDNNWEYELNEKKFYLVLD